MNGIISHVTPIYVLKHESPDDVARAMIASGHQEQPFYVFSMDEAYLRMQHFREKMPRVQIFYAMKSNDTDMMVRLVAALGVGFDCASPGEIYKIRKLGVHPSKIIYALPCKSLECIEYARNMGVEYTTFDSSCELQKMKKCWPNAKLLLRIRVDSDAKVKLGLKFGCDFESEAIGLLDEAARFGFKVVGVAFHVGSLCFSPKSYVLGLQRARALFDHEERKGRRMDIVNIGGGFLSNSTDAIDEVSCLINETLEDLFPDPNVQVFAEPGGYLCDSAFKMFSKIVGVRQIIKENVLTNMIYLNNGKHGSFRYDNKWHTLQKFSLTLQSTEEEALAKEEAIIWGPTCNSLDCMTPNSSRVILPRCLLNDWLVVENHGAYTLCLSTRFSSVEVPLIRSVISKDLWNSVKSSSVFQPSDFLQDPDISAPLPSTLPPLLPTCEIYEHSEI